MEVKVDEEGDGMGGTQERWKRMMVAKVER